jgi:hypothetical protein
VQSYRGPRICDSLGNSVATNPKLVTFFDKIAMMLPSLENRVMLKLVDARIKHGFKLDN